VGFIISDQVWEWSKVTAFEVLLNGKHLCTAGVESGTVMVLVTRTINTNWQNENNLPGETDVSVSGAEADTGDYIT
jgi:hypothetical protein